MLDESRSELKAEEPASLVERVYGELKPLERRRRRRDPVHAALRCPRRGVPEIAVRDRFFEGSGLPGVEADVHVDARIERRAPGELMVERSRRLDPKEPLRALAVAIRRQIEAEEHNVTGPRHDLKPALPEEARRESRDRLDIGEDIVIVLRRLGSC